MYSERKILKIVRQPLRDQIGDSEDVTQDIGSDLVNKNGTEGKMFVNNLEHKGLRNLSVVKRKGKNRRGFDSSEQAGLRKEQFYTFGISNLPSVCIICSAGSVQGRQWHRKISHCFLGFL